MKDDLISQRGVCLVNSFYLRDFFKLHKIPTYLEAKLSSIGENEIVIEKKGEKSLKLPVDSVIMSVGYNPDPLIKKGKNTYLVGDCLAVGNLRTVIWRAYEVAMKI